MKLIWWILIIVLLLIPVVLFSSVTIEIGPEIENETPTAAINFFNETDNKTDNNSNVTDKINVTNITPIIKKRE